MVRRRGKARRSWAWLRIKKYRLKYTHHIVPFILKLLLDRMAGKEETELGWLDYVEIQVFAKLEELGVSPDEWKNYMGMAKRCYHIFLTAWYNTAVNETAIIVEEYVLRGLDRDKLEWMRYLAMEKAGAKQGLPDIITEPPPPPPPPPEYLYLGFDLATDALGRIEKVNLTTFARTATLVLDAADKLVSGLARHQNFLYAITNTDPCRILKIDLATFTKVATLAIPEGAAFASSILVHEGFLYVGTRTPQGRIVKIDLATFTDVDRVNIWPNAVNVPGLVVVGDYIYAGTSWNPGNVVKVHLPTFTNVGFLSFVILNSNCFSLTASGNYLYAGTYWANPIVQKVSVATFTVVDTLQFMGDGMLTSSTVEGNFLYIGNNQVRKVDLTTFTQVDQVANPDGSYYDVFEIALGFLYVMCWSNPVKILKIDLTTYTHVDTLSLAAGQQFAWGSEAA